MRLLRFALRHRRAAAVSVCSAAVGLAAFSMAIRMDEGKKRHILKRLSEMRRMPERLLT